MEDSLVRNINILSWDTLPTPNSVREDSPTTEAVQHTVTGSRHAIEQILLGEAPQVVLVVGPCSIHDPVAAIDYAQRLRKLKDSVSDVFCVVMRVYFEKPRTTTGWKGYINDPDLDDSFKIDVGLKRARKLLLEINALGMPVGTEALDPITPQYLDDLISWTAIGARTVESQTHREMASGLSSPVGFKNGTDGNIEVMINAIRAVSEPHHFLGIDFDGRCSVFHTRGNRYAHAVLRGGSAPNYDSVHIRLTEEALAAAGHRPNIMVDCSHGNSSKKPELQPLVFENCIHQILEGNTSIMGLMLESHLHWGNQPVGPKNSLKYGVSVTDACIDWDTTETAIEKAAEDLRKLNRFS